MRQIEAVHAGATVRARTLPCHEQGAGERGAARRCVEGAAQATVESGAELDVRRLDRCRRAGAPGQAAGLPGAGRRCAGAHVDVSPALVGDCGAYAVYAGGAAANGAAGAAAPGSTGATSNSAGGVPRSGARAAAALHLARAYVCAGAQRAALRAASAARRRADCAFALCGARNQGAGNLSQPAASA
jgi:hypothetical protein